jgi:hypothetical protein
MVGRMKSLGVSSPRIQFLTFKGKQIFLVDFSRLSAVEAEETVRAVPEVVTTRARSSVLLLADFTDAVFDEEALRAMKEAAVFNKPFIRKTAWRACRPQFPVSTGSWVASHQPGIGGLQQIGNHFNVLHSGVEP